jgi:hypothetical protein
MDTLDDPRDGGPLTPDLEASLAERSRFIAWALRERNPELPHISSRLAQRVLVDRFGAMGFPLLAVLGIGIYRAWTGQLAWLLAAWTLVSVVILFLVTFYIIGLCETERPKWTLLAGVAVQVGLGVGPVILALGLFFEASVGCLQAPSLGRVAYALLAAALAYPIAKQTRLIAKFHLVIQWPAATP